MKSYKYSLEKGSKKHICPICTKKSLVRYIDNTTGGYIPEKYGRCDHESKCAYHLNPYKDGYAIGGVSDPFTFKYHRPKAHPTYFIPELILNDILNGYENNIFIQNLLKIAPVSDVEKAIALYRIGTINDDSISGNVAFPYIDICGNIRAIQVKQFDEKNHTTRTNFIHSIFRKRHNYNSPNYPEWLKNYLKNESYVTCLFGEHLLKQFPNNPIALVEAPKTAIIGMLYYGFPETPGSLLWLAVYNKSSLTLKKCKALKGRDIVLFPDLNAYNDWNEKSKLMISSLPGTRIIVHEILEKISCTKEREKGYDLADFLTTYSIEDFRKVNGIARLS